MAIIKCPECGHEISDKAPFCPSCGIAISGKIKICPVCGKAYFADQPECPQCHHKTMETNNEKVGELHDVATSIVGGETASMSNGDTDIPKHEVTADAPKSSAKRNNILVAVIAVVVALLVGGICWYFSHQTNVERENQAYELAMQSSDPQVVQKYLDTYQDDAPSEHIQAIEDHLAALKQVDSDWTNAVVSGSKSALEQYIAQHPDSPFKALAIHKIDSIDWAMATSSNTVEAMEAYLEQHSDGEHVEDANMKIKDLNSKTLQPEEKLMISGVFDSFFCSLNNRDEDALTSAVNPLLTSFLGKSNATRNDVVTFMHKIYKNDVTSMTWISNGDYTINKKEVGDEKYEYTVNFSAKQSISYTDNPTSNVKYKISAKINPEGRISEFNMVKIVE